MRNSAFYVAAHYCLGIYNELNNLFFTRIFKSRKMIWVGMWHAWDLLEMSNKFWSGSLTETALSKILCVKWEESIDFDYNGTVCRIQPAVRILWTQQWTFGLWFLDYVRDHIYTKWLCSVELQYLLTGHEQCDVRDGRNVFAKCPLCMTMCDYRTALHSTAQLNARTCGRHFATGRNKNNTK